MRAETPEALCEALVAAWSCNGPTVIDVPLEAGAISHGLAGDPCVNGSTAQAPRKQSKEANSNVIQGMAL
jgi:hypothetical protein